MQTSCKISKASAYLAFRQQRLDSGPRLALRGIAQQVHDDGALFDRFVYLEEIRTRHPAVLLRLFPASTVLSHANDHVESVVTEIQSLTVTLRAIADQRKCIIFEVVLSRH